MNKMSENHDQEHITDSLTIYDVICLSAQLALEVWYTESMPLECISMWLSSQGEGIRTKSETKNVCVIYAINTDSSTHSNSLPKEFT